MGFYPDHRLFCGYLGIGDKYTGIGVLSWIGSVMCTGFSMTRKTSRYKPPYMLKSSPSAASPGDRIVGVVQADDHAVGVADPGHIREIHHERKIAPRCLVLCTPFTIRLPRSWRLRNAGYTVKTQHFVKTQNIASLQEPAVQNPSGTSRSLPLIVDDQWLQPGV